MQEVEGVGLYQGILPGLAVLEAAVMEATLQQAAQVERLIQATALVEESTRQPMAGLELLFCPIHHLIQT
jgi:hypothetical protein